MLSQFGFVSPISPFICGGGEYFKEIGNAFGKYIDWSEPKENMIACAWIFIEVDLEKGMP